MALITDPDNLSDSVTDVNNVFIDLSAKTIKLTPGRGSLVAADGVTIKCVASFAKEEWRSDPNSKNLAAIDFPFVPLSDEFFELVDGWNWADATTRQTIRKGGWLVRNNSGGVTEHWAGLAILNAEADDQCYFDLGVGATDFTFTGNTSEAVQVIDDPNGDGNYADGYNRSANVTVYNREQGQEFSLNSSTLVGEATLLAPKLFSLGLPTKTDLNITASDATIATTAPYTGMSIEFFSAAQSRTIGSSSRDFGIIIDGNNGTKKQIYEFIQYSLRQSTDEDSGAGSLIGNVMPELLVNVGATLKTKTATNYQAGGTGVFIDNFAATDTNSLAFVDNTGTERAFPFVSAGTLEFNANLVNDTDAVYRVFFTDGVTAANRYGATAAIFVEDNGGNDLSGSVSGSSSIPFTFDYDGNNQGGRTAGTDANVTAIAIGLNTVQYVRTTAAIGRSNQNAINFVAAVERNYSNP